MEIRLNGYWQPRVIFRSVLWLNLTIHSEYSEAYLAVPASSVGGDGRAAHPLLGQRFRQADGDGGPLSRLADDGERAAEHLHILARQRHAESGPLGFARGGAELVERP